MSGMVEWIAASANEITAIDGSRTTQRNGGCGGYNIENLPAHQFPGKTTKLTTEATEEHREAELQNPHPVAENATRMGHPPGSELNETASIHVDREERRIYRRRTVTMLRRYMRYSIETGRLPSLLGREFFRARVTSYTVVTFEDRVIFVHDMEMCLSRLDEFSRQLIARHILQEHDQETTAKLLQCGERTVRRFTPMALDLLSEILLEVGLLERLFPDREKCCQGGQREETLVSSSEESKNKFRNLAG